MNLHKTNDIAIIPSKFRCALQWWTIWVIDRNIANVRQRLCECRHCSTWTKEKVL